MIRQLFTSVLCAFALFFLLLTGEEALHAQKANDQTSVTSELVNEYLVSQHQFKATSALKEANSSEAEVFEPISTSYSLRTPTWWEDALHIENAFLASKFVPDQRKIIGQLLYPYHFFW